MAEIGIFLTQCLSEIKKVPGNGLIQPVILCDNVLDTLYVIVEGHFKEIPKEEEIGFVFIDVLLERYSGHFYRPRSQGCKNDGNNTDHNQHKSWYQQLLITFQNAS